MAMKTEYINPASMLDQDSEAEYQNSSKMGSTKYANRALGTTATLLSASISALLARYRPLAHRAIAMK
jgi:hypothetical protein